MEQFYPKKNTTDSKSEGPSDLTIKRILAFSKAINSHSKKKASTEDQKDTSGS